MSEIYSHEFFFESSFNPIAIYRTEGKVSSLTSERIFFVNVNPAYERVNKVRKEDIIGRSFYDVWPTVEPCWGEIIVRCIKEQKSVHCENESAYTGKYLEVIAFPIADGMAATMFLDRTEWKKSDDGRPHAPPRSSASPWSFPPRGRLDHVCVDDLGLRGCGVVLTNAATHSSCVGASRGNPDSFSDTLPVPLGCGFITATLSGDGCPRGPCRSRRWSDRYFEAESGPYVVAP